eukprot:TRINITY_DN56963_c0_g1_i1.p1 TRINITY_DN56963_c0_g1~~TRINITY_DN56963_c0_g1_i1.p1  ORF type:complete len:484 (-),score=103.90 TRINITY_DN56963_c0_g1_i1:317-1711(-)
MGRRGGLRLIAADTKKCFTQGSYTNKSQQVVNFQEAVRRSIAESAVYLAEQQSHHETDENGKFINIVPRFSAPAVHEVATTTVLKSIVDIKQRFPDQHVGVLNFASARNPGGGWDTGAVAQEETIARGSTIIPCLTKFQEQFYTPNRKMSSCVYSHCMMWAPLVPVFKDDEGEPFDEPALCSFVTAPAVNAGVVRHRPSEAPGEERIETNMRERMDRVLYVFQQHKCDVLILGAFGCGVFRNDPAWVCQVWKTLLETKYFGCFSHVHYAILDPKMSTVFNSILCDGVDHATLLLSDQQKAPRRGTGKKAIKKKAVEMKKQQPTMNVDIQKIIAAVAADLYTDSEPAWKFFEKTGKPQEYIQALQERVFPQLGALSANKEENSSTPGSQDDDTEDSQPPEGDNTEETTIEEQTKSLAAKQDKKATDKLLQQIATVEIGKYVGKAYGQWLGEKKAAEKNLVCARVP